MRRQHAQLKQLPEVTMRAARGYGQRRCWLRQRRVRNSVDGARTSGGKLGWAKEGARLFELCATARTANAVVPHLGATAGQHMQQKAMDELLGRQGDAAQLLAAVVAITESDLSIFKVLQPIVTNSHAKDVASEVVECLATLAGRFAVDHPVFFP